ncbi:MAG TPA: hypothetical protein VLH61_06715 [Bacteroidales bacterium]|nr:hypothetical protein [Bacteroidales bacterium]
MKISGVSFPQMAFFLGGFHFSLFLPNLAFVCPAVYGLAMGMRFMR